MIQASFIVTSGDAQKTIPILLPTPEMRDMARALGYTDEDLFSVEIPSGATRYTRVRCIVDEQHLKDLYANENEYTRSHVARFVGKDDSADTSIYQQVNLLAPKPLFQRGINYFDKDIASWCGGLVMIEAVDDRWLWQQTMIQDRFTHPLAALNTSSDGRWTECTYEKKTPVQLITAIANAITTTFHGKEIDLTLVTATNFPDIMSSRFADLIETPNLSLAMMLDLVLSSCGWMMSGSVNSSGQYELTRVSGWNSDLDGLADTICKNDSLVQTMSMYGGMSPANINLSNSTVFALYGLPWTWATQRDNNVVWNVASSTRNITMSWPYRTVEGKTIYNNTSAAQNPTGGHEVLFTTNANYGYKYDTRMDASSGTLYPFGYNLDLYARVLNEPRSLVASAFPGTTGAIGDQVVNIRDSTKFGWDWYSYQQAVTRILEKRTTVPTGRILVSGWRLDYQIQWSIASRHVYHLRYDGDTVTACTLIVWDEDDWILGPSGKLCNDPKDIVIGKGLVQARRLASGALWVDAAPPQHRVFTAKITGYTQVSGAWRWKYSWVEVEKNASGEFVNDTGYEREGANSTDYNYAWNVTEFGNVFNVSVAPGILQSDYTDSTIEALPISDGTLVEMTETCPTLHSNDGVQLPRYCWFAMPNAVKVSCNSPIAPGITIDGGEYFGE